MEPPSSDIVLVGRIRLDTIISGLQVLRGVHRLVRGTPDRAPSQA